MKKTKFVKRDWQEFAVDLLSVIEFAKEFWGTEIMFPEDFGMSTHDWQYHLGRIIMSPDPLKKIKQYYNGQINRKVRRRNGKTSR